MSPHDKNTVHDSDWVMATHLLYAALSLERSRTYNRPKCFSERQSGLERSIITSQANVLIISCMRCDRRRRTSLLEPRPCKQRIFILERSVVYRNGRYQRRLIAIAKSSTQSETRVEGGLGWRFSRTSILHFVALLMY